MGAVVADDGSRDRPDERIITVPRSMRSRILGSSGIPFPLPSGIAFALLTVNGLIEGTKNIPPEDRVSPAGVVFIGLGLTTLAIGGLLLGVVEWRRSVKLTPAGIDVHTGWKRRQIPWPDVEAVEFCQIRMGQGTIPAAAVIRKDGSRVELRALAQAGRRVRQRQVDVLATACKVHQVDLRSDGSWYWRRIALDGEPGGLRATRR
jgi:hypothetical protein